MPRRPPAYIDQTRLMVELKCSLAHTYNLRREGLLAPPVLIARKAYWRREDVESCLRACEARERRKQRGRKWPWCPQAQAPHHQSETEAQGDHHGSLPR